MPRGTKHPAPKAVTQRLREYCAALLGQFSVAPADLWDRAMEKLRKSQSEAGHEKPPGL